MFLYKKNANTLNGAPSNSKYKFKWPQIEHGK